MASAPRRASLGIVFGVVFLDLLGFGILIPQLGVYGVRFHGTPFEIGLLLSAYSLMQLVSAPVLGWLSDRYGRRPVLLYSIAGSTAAYLLFGFAQSLPLLFVARIVDGISGGNISTAQAYVADVTGKEQRARGMGMIGMAFGLGFTLGPAIGGFLGALGGNLAIGLFAASLSAVNWLLVFLLLPETRRPGSPMTHTGALSRIPALLQLPAVGGLLLLFLLFTTAFAQMEGTFSVFVIERFLRPDATAGIGLFDALARTDDPLSKEASLKVGYLFVLVGVISAVVQGGLIGRLTKRFTSASLAVAGVVVTGAGLFFVPVSPSYLWLFAPMALVAVGSALSNPSMSTLISLSAPEHQRGEVMGAYQAMGSLGRMLGPAAGGFLFGSVGYRAPFWVAAAMLAGCTVLTVHLRRLLLRSATRGQAQTS